MSDRIDDLPATTVVALITFTEPSALQHYRTHHDLPFPVLTDPTRAAYRAYGLGRGSLGRIWGWRAARRYLELFRRRDVSAMKGPNQDTRQLGGDFVIAPDGTLAWGFWGEGPDDRPSVDELIAQVEAATTP